MTLHGMALVYQLFKSEFDSPDLVNLDEVTNRSRNLGFVLRERSFCEQFLGQTMAVLWEKETSPGSSIYSGLTSNYIRVFTHSEKSLNNEITPVKLVEFHNQGIWGEIVNENPG